MKLIAVVVFLLSIQAQAQMIARVVLNPVGDFQAKDTVVSGHATMTGTKVHAENITVDLRVLQTGMTMRDNHAKNKYLEVNKYPDAVLVKADGENGKGTGLLRFHGVEKQVEGTYEVKGDKLTAHFPIKLSDFGIKDISYQGVGVEDEVKIDITVPVQAGPAGAPAKPKK